MTTGNQPNPVRARAWVITWGSRVSTCQTINQLALGISTEDINFQFIGIEVKILVQAACQGSGINHNTMLHVAS
jgi:hypothetical protein